MTDPSGVHVTPGEAALAREVRTRTPPAPEGAYSVPCPACEQPAGAWCVGVYVPSLTGVQLRDPHHVRLISIGG